MAALACAHGGRPPGDATRDPEFQAALRRSRPEFPRQRDALAAGLYEPFTAPESLPPPAGGRKAAAAPDGKGTPAGGPVAAAAPRAGSARSPVASPAGREDDVGAGEEESTAEEPLLARGGPPPEPETPAAAGGYAIQVGAFSDAGAAAERADRIRRAADEWPVEVVPQNGWLKVLVGSFATRSEAEMARAALSARGFGSAWVTRRAP